jgi:peptidoglycan lytic transglycosylase A
MIWFTTTAAFAEGPVKFAGSQLEPIKWSELAGWTADDHLAAFAAYQASCQALRKRRTDDRGQISGALSNVCRKAADLQPQDANTARAFFEQNFQPVRIARLGEAEGLLTGYFEPIVAGSRYPGPEFPVPLYRRPRDLVAAGYKPGSLAFPNKGVRIGRRTENNELVPYHDRGAIEAGALDGQKLEICWLKSSSDLLAIQIEGSGRVILEDGTPLRVAFDSHNGYAFSSIERVLIDRNIISREEISTQRIREWMAAHPDEAVKVRAANRSYVFFRVTGLSHDGEPVGAQGVPLTAGRSIAVDRVHEYGTPFFIEANLPIESGKSVSPFRRLMIAQDTGSAIVGPARADLYWGAGDDAGRIAGRIRHPGRFVMLLPRELDPIAAQSEIPLPVAKPKIAEVDFTKHAGEGSVESAGAAAIIDGRRLPLPTPKLATLDVTKRSGEGKMESANAGAVAASRQKPLPALAPKIAAREVGKQDGKGKPSSTSDGATAAGRTIRLQGHKPEDSAIKVKKQDDKGKAQSDGIGWTLGRQKPSPAPIPKIVALETGDPDGKGKTSSGNTGAIAPGRQKPSPTRTPKIAAFEVGRQDGKANAGQKPPPAPTPRIAALENQDIGRPILLPVLKPTNSKIEVKKQDPKGRANSTNAGEVMAGRHLLSPAPKSKKQSGKGEADSESAAGREKPLSAPKPKITVKKQDGKGSTNSANAGEIAADRHLLSPTPKSKKQSGKGEADSEIAAGREKPLSAPKPKITGIEVKKQNGKGRINSANAGEHPLSPTPKSKTPDIELKKQNGKGKADSDNAGEIAAGRQKSLPVPKSKTSGIEVKKQGGKDRANSASAGAVAASRHMPLPATKSKMPGNESKKQDGKE